MRELSFAVGGNVNQCGHFVHANERQTRRHRPHTEGWLLGAEGAGEGEGSRLAVTEGDELRVGNTV